MLNPHFLPDEDKLLYKQNKKKAVARMREEYVKSTVPLARLCEWYGAPMSEVLRYIEKQRWEEARLRYSSAIFGQLEAARNDVNADEYFFLYRTKTAGMATLARYLETLATSGAVIDLNEADRISKIVERMSKLENLKRGNPTSISATKSLEGDDISPDDYAKALAATRIEESGDDVQN
jgi:hypothetical protein